MSIGKPPEGPGSGPTIPGSKAGPQVAPDESSPDKKLYDELAVKLVAVKGDIAYMSSPMAQKFVETAERYLHESLPGFDQLKLRQARSQLMLAESYMKASGGGSGR